MQKKRKTGGPGNGPEAIALMNRMYASVNALKSDAGEDLNTFFLKPVDKKVSPAPRLRSSRTLCTVLTA